MSPLPPAVRHLLEQHWQCGRRGERRAHWHSKLSGDPLLFADYLPLMSNNPNHMQSMLNILRALRKSCVKSTRSKSYDIPFLWSCIIPKRIANCNIRLEGSRRWAVSFNESLLCRSNGNAAVQCLNSKQELYWKKDFASWHHDATELTVRWLLLILNPISCLPWMVRHNPTCSKKAAEVWAHWSRSFLVDLRESYSDYCATYSDPHLRVRNSKRSSYHQWCALPTKRALVMCLSYILPRYMFLDLPQDAIRSKACFRLAHTLQVETMTWTHNTSTATASDLPTPCELKQWPGLTYPSTVAELG